MRVLRQLLTILLLLCCLGPLGTPLGIVLCFGADGHIAFKPAISAPTALLRQPSQSLSVRRWQRRLLLPKIWVPAMI